MQEISSQYYTNFKNEVLDQTNVQRIKLPLKSINIIDLDSIEISGRLVKFAKEAINDLLEILGVNQSFTRVISSAYDSKALSIILKSIKASKNIDLTLVYSPKRREITSVYKGDKIISDSQFFETMEKYMDKSEGSYLRNISQSSRGNISAVIANPKYTFQFGKLNDETFKSGVSFDLTPVKMSAGFFTERLVCLNGMVAPRTTYSQSATRKEQVTNFINNVVGDQFNTNNIAEFRSKINRAIHTPSSLSEVLSTNRALNQFVGDQSNLLADTQLHHVINAFNEDYMNATDIHKFLRTDMTKWELINEVTAVSSKLEGLGLNRENLNKKLQGLGGRMLFERPDHIPTNIKQLF